MYRISFAGFPLARRLLGLHVLCGCALRGMLWQRPYGCLCCAAITWPRLLRRDHVSSWLLQRNIMAWALQIGAASAPALSSLINALPRPRRVQITVIDGTGRRFPIRGVEGQNIVEILEADEGPLDVSDCELCTSVCCALLELLL